MSGTQTWFAFVKPESLGDNRFMSKYGSQRAELYIGATGTVRFILGGLSTYCDADVRAEAGKWYFIVGVYDASAEKLKVYVNGVKKEVTVTGSHTDGNGDFSVGRNGSDAGNYYDGLVQGAGVLSKALTDDEVSALWWNTLGKKTKLRRATTDGYIEQSLPQSLVEQYRGKTLSVTAKAYQDTASIAQVSLVDDTTETESTASATTGEWIEIGATQTIDADTADIKCRVKVSDADGNAWFGKVQVYEGSTLVYEWSPSVKRLVRIIRQENDKGNYEQEAVILTGWGGITNANQISVSFGITFSETPLIQITGAGGDPLSSTKTYPATSFAFIDRIYGHYNESTTGFTARMSGGNPSSSQVAIFNWLAIGTI